MTYQTGGNSLQDIILIGPASATQAGTPVPTPAGRHLCQPLPLLAVLPDKRDDLPVHHGRFNTDSVLHGLHRALPDRREHHR